MATAESPVPLASDGTNAPTTHDFSTACALATNKRKRTESINNLGSTQAWAPAAAEPLLESMLGEPMYMFYGRLRRAVEGNLPADCRPAHDMQQDGLYLMKRPVRDVDGTSPLAACGSVLHHVVLYHKRGDQVHSIDFGPSNFQDVTSNLMAEAPARRALHCPPLEPPLVPAGSGSGYGAAGAAAPRPLPLLYLGQPALELDSAEVQEALAFAEARPYHALRNNCIHFADFCVRVLTAGAVRGAPLLFDLACGSVPPVDNPMLVMMQMMMQMPWSVVVDGSPLMRDFLRARAQGEQPVGEAGAGEAGATAADGTEHQQEQPACTQDGAEQDGEPAAGTTEQAASVAEEAANNCGSCGAGQGAGSGPEGCGRCSGGGGAGCIDACAGC